MNKQEFKTITALTHTQINSLIKTENIQADHFEQKKFVEICDLNNESIRYILSHLSTKKAEKSNFYVVSA